MSEQALPEGFNRNPLQRGVEEGVQWAVYPAPLWGAANGYVYVPPMHPGHGKRYDDEVFENIDAPGGLTYSGEGWIGFDTLHAWDYWPGMPSAYDFMKSMDNIEWTVEMVVEETQKLALQIAEGCNV